MTGAYPPGIQVRQLARLARRVDCLFVCRFSRPSLLDNRKFSEKTKQQFNCMIQLEGQP